MMSPIASASAKEQHASGFAAKGTGRRSTTFRRPSIATIITTADSIETLGKIRQTLIYGSYQGTVQPSDKTEREWERVFWKRVIELILSADGENVCPTFIYNHQLRWHKSPGVAALIEAAVGAQCKIIPSPAERLRAMGIK